MQRFRVALSGDFLRPDGTPAYPDVDLAPLLQRPDIEVAYTRAAEAIEAADIAGFDALILLGMRMNRESFPADGRLAVIARFGVGYDTVDVQACTDNDCVLAIAPDGVRRPMAVAILTLMLALTTRLLTKDRLTRAGPRGWDERAEHMGMGLIGRTLVSIGIGNIGAESFRLARPLGMTFAAHDPYADPQVVAELGIRLVDLDEAFRIADVLSISAPLNDTTRGLVGERLLSLMKPTAVLINTARGAIVDQAALTSALQERRIAGAGLDVFTLEPTASDDPLLTLDNVILTPHALGYTDQAFAGMGASDVAAVLAVMAGQPPKTVVNRDVLDRPGFQAKLRRYAEAAATAR